MTSSIQFQAMTLYRCITNVTLVALLLSTSLRAFAQDDDDGGGGGDQSFVVTVKRKQENKYKNRWTLASWFETQRKVRLQNQWLAAQRQANPYEFSIGYDGATLAEKLNGLPDVNRTYSSRRASLAAFASIVGLEGRWVEHGDDAGKGYDAFFHLRLLGSSIQSTNLTLSYGIRNREYSSSAGKETVQNQFPQGSLTLYLTNHLGIEGAYRKLQDAKSNLGTTLSGDVTEATVFIDFSFVRPYGTWFKENMKAVYASGAETVTATEGTYAGLRIFF